MKEKTITIKSSEYRSGIIKEVILKKISQKVAGESLRVSERQVRRLIVRYKKEGKKGLEHKLKGKESTRRIKNSIRKKIRMLVKEKYFDFNATHMAEFLKIKEGIRVSREWVRKFLIEEKIRTVKGKKRQKVHAWRERKKYAGEMIQMDGSTHEWFGKGFGKCCLMVLIDDATGHVYGRLFKYEGTYPALQVVKDFIEKYGIPKSIYVDKHVTYRSPNKPTEDEKLEGKEVGESNFEKVMRDMGIQIIYAHSPQAKGRVERSNRTHQDRLVKELRLKGIKTLEEANDYLNEYLKRHNDNFEVKAEDKRSQFREISKHMDLESLFSTRENRKVQNGNLIFYDGNRYVIEGKRQLKGKKVEVRKKLSKEIEFMCEGKLVKVKKLKREEKIKVRKREIKARKRKESIYRRVKEHYDLIKPEGEGHPWSRSFIEEKTEVGRKCKEIQKSYSRVGRG